MDCTAYGPKTEITRPAGSSNSAIHRVLAFPQVSGPLNGSWGCHYQSVVESLVVPFQMVSVTNSRIAFRNELSPNRIICSRQASLMVRTNRSAYAFRFGDRGGSLTDSMPEPRQYGEKVFGIERISVVDEIP